MANEVIIVGSPITEYVSRDDLDQLFGAANIDMWADKDNDQDSVKIAARVAWAIAVATDDFRARMRVSTYNLAELPGSLSAKLAVTRKAGDVLYTSRAVSDAEPGADLLRIHRKLYLEFIQDIYAGRIVLEFDRACQAYPEVYLED